MSNIIINSKNHTIEMNKAYAKKAAKYGSPEYNELQDVRRDYPAFRVVTVAKKAAITPAIKYCRFHQYHHRASDREPA